MEAEISSDIGLKKYLSKNYRIDDIYNYIKALKLTSPNKIELANLRVSNKTRTVHHKNGIFISSPFNLKISIDKEELNLNLPDGTALFISNDREIIIPEDFTIVAVENFTNLLYPKAQSYLLENFGNVIFKVLSNFMKNRP
ncbi:MAG: hypothetical protein K6348_07335 [Deferribacterales bacterium]